MIPDFEELMRRAETGDKEAQYELAQMFQRIGDNNSAEKYYKASAKQGHVSAQYDEGAISEYGLIDNPDWDNAIKWYKKAADQGHKEAKLALDSLLKRLSEQ